MRLTVQLDRWDDAQRLVARGQWHEIATSRAQHPPRWSPELHRIVADLVLACAIRRAFPPHALLGVLTELHGVLRHTPGPGAAPAHGHGGGFPVQSAAPDAMDIDRPGAPAPDPTLVTIHGMLHALCDAIAVADHLAPTTAPDAPLAVFVNLLHLHAPWCPTSLIIAMLPLPLLEHASLVVSDAVDRKLRQTRAVNAWTLPQFSLASEDVEGYMNLFVVLADAAPAPLPASATPDDPLVASLAKGMWRKVEDVIVMHKLSRTRVAEALLRVFAARLTTHWQLYLHVFRTVPFPDLGQILGFVLHNVAAESMKRSTSSMVDDLHQHRTDLLIAPADPYLSRLNRMLSAYQDSLPTFLSVPGTKPQDRAEADRLTRDMENTQLYVKKFLTNPGTLPRNLLLVTALLVQHETVELDAVLAHFTVPESVPLASIIVPPWNDVVPMAAGTNSELLAPARLPFATEVLDVLNVQVTAATAGNRAETPAPGATATTTATAPATPATAPDLTASLTSDAAASTIEAALVAQVVANLAMAQLAIGDIHGAHRVLAAYPDVDWVLAFPRIAQQLLRLIDWMLADHDDADIRNDQLTPTVMTLPYPNRQRFFYAPWTRHLQRGDTAQITLLLDLVGPALHLRPAVVLQIAYMCATTGDAQQSVAWLRAYVLPAMAMMGTPPPALPAAVWTVIRDWPVQRRFALYADMRNAYTRSAALARALDRVQATTRYWMKRLSKDVVRTYARKLCKLAMGNPIPVLAAIVATVMNYDNLAVPLLDCLRYLDPLGMDALMYTFLCALADPATYAGVAVAGAGRARGANAALLASSPLGTAVKDDGLNLDPWLLNTSQFMAAWLAQFPGTDFAPLLAYLDHAPFGLADAHLLADLVAAMTGIQPIVDVPANVVAAMESRACVAQRVVAASNQSNAAIPAAATSSLVARIAPRAEAFTRRLRTLYLTLAERTRDWAAYEVVEKVRTVDLLAEVQWKDRVRAVLAQFHLFLAIHLPDVVVDRTCALAPPLEERQAASVFWGLRYYHVHCDAGMYLPTESEELKRHLTDVTEATAKIEAVITAATQGMDVDGLPTAADLVRRACASPADTLYAQYWLTRLPLTTASAVLTHIWTVRGLTEAEAFAYGQLAAHALDLLHGADADASAVVSGLDTAEIVGAKHAAAARALAAHDAVAELVAYAMQGETMDLYLVRNTLNVLKALARVFPATKAHAEGVRAALEVHRQNDALRVMVLVVEGAVREMQRKGFPLEKRLVPPPPPEPVKEVVMEEVKVEETKNSEGKSTDDVKQGPADAKSAATAPPNGTPAAAAAPNGTPASAVNGGSPDLPHAVAQLQIESPATTVTSPDPMQVDDEEGAASTASTRAATPVFPPTLPHRPTHPGAASPARNGSTATAHASFGFDAAVEMAGFDRADPPAATAPTPTSPRDHGLPPRPPRVEDRVSDRAGDRRGDRRDDHRDRRDSRHRDEHRRDDRRASSSSNARDDRGASSNARDDRGSARTSGSTGRDDRRDDRSARNSGGSSVPRDERDRRDGRDERRDDRGTSRDRRERDDRTNSRDDHDRRLSRSSSRSELTDRRDHRDHRDHRDRDRDRDRDRRDMLPLASPAPSTPGGVAPPPRNASVRRRDSPGTPADGPPYKRAKRSPSPDGSGFRSPPPPQAQQQPQQPRQQQQQQQQGGGGSGSRLSGFDRVEAMAAPNERPMSGSGSGGSSLRSSGRGYRS
ncbi:THO complex subunit 2 [Allomyces javanicus]|nr:THO complex subunit 2 [Allomyces javanicus]